MSDPFVEAMKIIHDAKHQFAIPHRVIINGHSAGCFDKVVFALTPKDALIKALESIPDDSPMWQAPGFDNVQAFHMRQAFIIPTEGGR